MLVHSYIYYVLDSSIISDHLWQKWADELEKIQKENPSEINIGFFDDAFADWTGSTGAFLPLKDPWVFNKSHQVLREFDRLNQRI